MLRFALSRDAWRSTLAYEARRRRSFVVSPAESSRKSSRLRDDDPRLLDRLHRQALAGPGRGSRLPDAREFALADDLEDLVGADLATKLLAVPTRCMMPQQLFDELHSLCDPPLRRLPTPRRFLRRDPHRTSVSDAPFRRRAPISSVCAASQNRPLDAVDEFSAFRGPAEAAERLAGRPSFVAKSLRRRAGHDDMFPRARARAAPRRRPKPYGGAGECSPCCWAGGSGAIARGSCRRARHGVGLTMCRPLAKRSADCDAAGARVFAAAARSDPGVCDEPGAVGSIEGHVEGRASVQSPAAVALPSPRRAANMRRHARGASPAHSHAGLSWA